MFKEDETTGSPVKQTKKNTLTQKMSSPTKRKAKATGKRTGGRPTQKLQTTRRSLGTDNTLEKKKTEPDSGNCEDNRSNTSSEDVAPSPKRQNQKSTLPALAPRRKPTRNRQSVLTSAFGNALPINTINEQESNEVHTANEFRFEIN